MCAFDNDFLKLNSLYAYLNLNAFCETDKF